MDKMEGNNIAVIGDGSWGTAIVKMLCENLDVVNWWVKDDFVKDYIEEHEHNPKHLSSVEFDTDKLRIFTSIDEIVAISSTIIFVVPSIYVVGCLAKLTIPIKDKVIFSAIKGIIPDELCIVGEYLNKKFDVPTENMGTIVGPCHAEEVAQERKSYLTITAYDSVKAESVAKLLSSDFISTSVSNDVMGTEYAAVLKNIYAIAAGIAHALSYGDNFQAVLMSNAVREMNLFIANVSPMGREICESAYLGDLLVTGYSYHSRNRLLGNMIGKGYTARSAIMEMNMVAEGYYATKGIHTMLEKLDIEMPICEAVYKILYEKQYARRVFSQLSALLD